MYPYTQNTGTLIAVLKAIGSHGIPDKFTTKELPVWGFKSSNDRSVVGVLRFIGFIDASGVPQQLWRDARTKPEAAVAEGARSGYSELFKTFPDADRKDAEALTNFFKAKTSVGDAMIKLMVATFRALAQYGDFNRPSDQESEVDQSEMESKTAIIPSRSTTVNKQLANGAGLTINLNIELVVPTDATGEVYDKFFAAMKKHLIDE